MKLSKDGLLNVATLLSAACAMLVAVVVVKRDFASAPAGVQQQGQPSGVRSTRVVANWKQYESGGHFFGSPNAPVTIVEFGDYECPACGAFEKVLGAVLPRHRQDVLLVFRDWPLPYHRFAYPSARAAACADEQGRYVAYHDLLYAHQDSLGLISFRAFAERAGISDLKKFDACASAIGGVPGIDSAVAPAKSLHSIGTPTLLVNGLLLGSVPDSAELEQIIARAKKS